MIIYCDSEEDRERKIAEADRRDAWFRKKSRQDAQNKTTRRQLNRRANSSCEICRFRFSSILVVHHIIPVQYGGSANPQNLILICPNCHGLVHHYSHFRRPDRWPEWIKGLMLSGYNESQANRLLLVASREAVIHDNGLLEYRERAEPICYMLMKERNNQ